MLITELTAYGRSVNLVCDQKCEKAWGILQREKVKLSSDDEYFEYMADGELGIAPENLQTYEGDDAKPLDRQHNRWCLRECERSCSDVSPKIPTPLDFTKRIRNKGI